MLVDTVQSNFRSGTYDDACPRIPRQLIEMYTIGEGGAYLDGELDENVVVFITNLFTMAGYSLTRVNFASQLDVFWTIVNAIGKDQVLMVDVIKEPMLVKDLFPRHTGRMLENWPIGRTVGSHHINIGALMTFTKDINGTRDHQISVIWCQDKWQICNSNDVGCHTESERVLLPNFTILELRIFIIRDPEMQHVLRFKAPANDALSLEEWKAKSVSLKYDGVLSWDDVNVHGRNRAFKIYSDGYQIGSSDKPEFQLSVNIDDDITIGVKIEGHGVERFNKDTHIVYNNKEAPEANYACAHSPSRARARSPSRSRS